MLKYVINETQDEKVADAVDQLIQILITDLPEDKETIMTFAQQLEQRGLKRGLEEGEHRKAIAVAKILLTEGRSAGGIQKLTGLSEKEVMDLVDKH